MESLGTSAGFPLQAGVVSQTFCAVVLTVSNSAWQLAATLSGSMVGRGYLSSDDLKYVLQ